MKRWIGALFLGLLLGLLGTTSSAQSVTNAIVIRSLQAMGLFGGGYADGEVPVWDTTTLKYLPGAAGTGASTANEYWVGAAAADLSAEKNLGALGTALVINTAGVPSAYTGIDCTNQFTRDVSAVGAGTCAAVVLTADVTGVLPVANGGTNASTASITSFNNITGFTAAGSTGTTSTNLVFSTSPTLVAPVLGAASATSLQTTSATVGIGVGVAPIAGYGLYVKDTSGDKNLLRVEYDRNASGAAGFLFSRAKGSGADVVDGDMVYEILGQAMSTSYFNGAAIQSYVDGAVTAGQRPPSRLEFYTNPSNTPPAKNLTLSADGTFTITNDLIITGIQAGAAGDTDACLDVTTNELTDAGASTCIVSSLRFKGGWTPLPLGALAQVLRLETGSFYNLNDPNRVSQIGLNAENMARVEPRLAFYEQSGPDIGKPRGVLYEQSVALLTKAIQELTACVKATDARACLLALEAQ